MELRPDHQFDPLAPGRDVDENDGIDFDGTDFSDPSTLSQMLGMPVPYKAPDSVRREARERLRNIFVSYDTLREMLVRHEATIQKRWAKKKKQQRIDILTSAWPGMATVHRPDFDAFRKESSPQRTMGTKYRHHFIWPYVNQEDLSKPKTLLLLLNARGRHHPSEFAAADLEAMHLGIVTKSIVPEFLNEYVLVLNGVSNAQDYGKLLSWSDHPDAFDWMHTQKQFLPGEGLLVLEAQERILAFLVNCCRQILHDIPDATLTSDAFPPQPEPHLKSERESDGLETLAVMMAEAPYRVPAQLDLGRIESLLRARASAAEDHLWALREDPGYLAELLSEAKEHWNEMIKDVDGNAHPSLRPGRQGIFWARVVSNVLLEAHFELEVYSEFGRQAQELQTLHAKHAAAISPTKDLPEEFLAAMLKFRFYLDKASKGPLEQLKASVAASPPMRRFYVREPPTDVNSTRLQVMSRRGIKMSKIESQLTWLLSTLWEDGNQLFLVRLPLALDELERLLLAEPEAKDLVSARVAGVIGNLSILSQCSTQLDLFQPWVRSFESDMVDRADEIEGEFAERTKLWARMVTGLNDKHLFQAARLCDPSDNRFFYPSDKRRIKENTEALRRAEQNLDSFWAIVDRVVRAECGSLEGTAVRRLLSQQRIPRRTPEWVDSPAAASRRWGQQRTSDLDVDTAIYKPLSTLYFDAPPGKADDASRSGQASIPPKTKTKTKTRGQPSEEAPPIATPPRDTEAAAVPEPAPMAVDARALKVFRTLFFDPAVTSSPGEVSWNDFLYALTSTGMFAAEKLYGSVWQFKRVDGVDQSRIQFHEPHPRGKIPFVVAWRHGRRLNRAYGWVGDMFVLRAK